MQKAISKQELSLIPIETIGSKILLIRGQKVMLDSDLAELYGVTTIRLNEQVRRNADRFPFDFMFQITKEEYQSLRFQNGTSNSKEPIDLRSQFAISKKGRGGRRYLPYVFTEHGVAMLSSVLNSKKAVEMNILIIRAFIKIREILSSNKEMSYKIEELEREQKIQNKHINSIYSLIKKLLDEPPKPKGKIGYART